MKPINQNWNIFFTDKMNVFYMSLTSLPNQTPEQEVAKRYIFFKRETWFFSYCDQILCLRLSMKIWS